MDPATAGIIGGAQILGGIGGARAARRAAHQQQRGIQQGQIALQGGVDQAVASVNAPIDQALLMNRPYSDAGIGAMANVNAMLGIPATPQALTDVSQYETKMTSLKGQQDKIKKELELLKKISSSKNFNTKGYATGAWGDEYKGMHRDQISNKISALQNKLKMISTEYKGIEKTYTEAQRQNSLITSTNEAIQNRPGGAPQPISAFNFEQRRQPTSTNTGGANIQGGFGPGGPGPNSILGLEEPSPMAALEAPRQFQFNEPAPGPFEFQFNEADPSYQWRLNQGLEALNRSYAARGGLGSGSRMTGIMDYAQGLASTEYQNQFGRALATYGTNADEYQRGFGRAATSYGINAGEYQNAFERSMAEWRSNFDVLNANLGIAGMGAQATGTNIGNVVGAGRDAANLYMSGAQGMAGLYGQSGSAAAAGVLGRNNAIQQGIGQLAYLGGQAGWFGGGGGSSQAANVDASMYNPDQYAGYA
jgi:hypothetical protein